MQRIKRHYYVQQIDAWFFRWLNPKDVMYDPMNWIIQIVHRMKRLNQKQYGYDQLRLYEEHRS